MSQKEQDQEPIKMGQKVDSITIGDEEGKTRKTFNQIVVLDHRYCGFRLKSLIEKQLVVRLYSKALK